MRHGLWLTLRKLKGILHNHGCIVLPPGYSKRNITFLNAMPGIRLIWMISEYDTPTFRDRRLLRFMLYKYYWFLNLNYICILLGKSFTLEAVLFMHVITNQWKCNLEDSDSWHILGSWNVIDHHWFRQWTEKQYVLPLIIYNVIFTKPLYVLNHIVISKIKIAWVDLQVSIQWRLFRAN